MAEYHCWLVKSNKMSISIQVLVQTTELQLTIIDIVMFVEIV